MSNTALIIVDAQNDFLPPDGALAVPDGDQVIPVIQDLLDGQWDWSMVVASQVSLSAAAIGASANARTITL